MKYKIEADYEINDIVVKYCYSSRTCSKEAIIKRITEKRILLEEVIIEKRILIEREIKECWYNKEEFMSRSPEIIGKVKRILGISYKKYY